MSHVDDESLLSSTIRTMQIIIFALTLGLVFFLAIILFIGNHPAPAPPRPGDQPAQASPMISYMAVAVAVVAIPLSLLVPSLVVKTARKQIAQGTWRPPDRGTGTLPQGALSDTLCFAAVYQTSLIVGAALNEGAAFLALIAYMVEGLPAILGLAVLLIVGVAARFPTRARVEQWIDAQKELLLEEKQAGG
jgi:hypothetical protein